MKYCSTVTYESKVVHLPSFNELNDLTASATTVVPGQWIDFMGHMNVMWYTHLFGQAVLDFFQTIGLTHEYFRENNTGSFVLEQHIRYIAEIREGENISLRTRALGRSEKRLHFQVYLIKEEMKMLAASSEIVTVHIDMSIRRSSPLPMASTQSFDRVQELHSRLSWVAPCNGFSHP